MKSSHHSDHSDSDGSTGDKSVKFTDENTIERHYRRKQIEQDNILETILSEDELETASTEHQSKGESCYKVEGRRSMVKGHGLWFGV